MFAIQPGTFAKPGFGNPLTKAINHLLRALLAALVLQFKMVIMLVIKVRKRGIPPMSKSVITSYTLMDFLSEADMITFLSFAEKNMQKHADYLRANGMTKF